MTRTTFCISFFIAIWVLFSVVSGSGGTQDKKKNRVIVVFEDADEQPLKEDGREVEKRAADIASKLLTALGEDDYHTVENVNADDKYQWQRQFHEGVPSYDECVHADCHHHGEMTSSDRSHSLMQKTGFVVYKVFKMVGLVISCTVCTVASVIVAIVGHTIWPVVFAVFAFLAATSDPIKMAILSALCTILATLCIILVVTPMISQKKRVNETPVVAASTTVNKQSTDSPVCSFVSTRRNLNAPRLNSSSATIPDWT